MLIIGNVAKNQIGIVPAIITSDSFNRADGSLTGSETDCLYGGSNLSWVTLGSAPVISSNQLGRGGSNSKVLVDTSATDHRLKINISTLNTSASLEFYVRSNIDNSTAYVFYMTGSNGGSNIYIYKKVSGAYTSLQVLTSPIASGSVIEIQAFGSSIKMWDDGVLKLNVTNSDITTGTYTGFTMLNEDSTRLDNFIVSVAS